MSEKYTDWPGNSDRGIMVNYYDMIEPVRPHKHDFIEIVFLARGSCIHRYRETEAALIPGDVFVIFPHEEHSYEINSEVGIYNCLFYPSVLGEDWHKLRKIKGVVDFLFVEPLYRTEVLRQEILHLPHGEAAYIESLLMRIIEEERNRYAGTDFAQKSYLLLFLIALGRSWEHQFIGYEDIYSGKRNLLANALKYIETNIKEDIKIRELAANSYLSPHYFRKLFREATGLTPIEYINKLRVAEATRLLADKNLSISSISEAVGIRDLTYFSRLFKSITGYTPSQYRKIR